ncbi:Mkk1p [Rhizophagus irregularis DAOM 197198w]|uniref:Mkk1p n=2 Tax=Rhizophagus irregularis (strain DAOM 197198w) TaxID=1432141 RepID=A0A015KFN1_RHIIW|nr:Mkk1p [Rhizophagus irregularis DAOM 197198w]
MVHRDFHPGNILFNKLILDEKNTTIYIADMGLCGQVDDLDETKIYGVMPYVAPEVLRGKPYTISADIYSFGMIMYFTATGRQPFANREHDFNLMLEICKENIRPEINEQEAPRFYIDLMKRCWSSDPDSRPDVSELESLFFDFLDDPGIEDQLKEADEYRRALIENNQSTHSSTYSKAICVSRILDTSELEGQLDEMII